MSSYIEDTLHQYIGESIREDASEFSLGEAVHLIEERMRSLWSTNIDEEVQVFYEMLPEINPRYRKEDGFDAPVPVSRRTGSNQVS